MLRTILIYGAILAVRALGLSWLEYQYVVRAHPAETWLVLIALIFMGLGIWVGSRLFGRVSRGTFEPNTQVQATLRISARELEVLELLAAG